MIPDWALGPPNLFGDLFGILLLFQALPLVLPPFLLLLLPLLPLLLVHLSLLLFLRQIVRLWQR